MRKIAVLFAVLLLTLTIGTALASATPGGAVETVAPPASVEYGSYQSDAFIRLFQEQDDVTLASAVAVDIVTPGTYVGPSAILTPGTVAADTCVDSYMLHMDPVTGAIYLNGSVTFSDEILGLIVLNDSLNATDAMLGAAGTVYGYGELGRRVELTAGSPGVDTVELSTDRKTLSVNLWVDPTWTDQIRILVKGTCTIDVGIDIKPGSYPNAININGNGVVPVAILGSADFDVTQIDWASLSFGGLTVRTKKNGSIQCAVEDVSGDFTYPEGAPDGYDDLVCQFVDEDGFLAAGDGTAQVSGTLYDGTPFLGSDTIKLVNE